MSVAEPLAETQNPASETEARANGTFLDSLEIENFRAFRHLTIPRLGRVNLITGKNNVGKTTLLEALWFYQNRGSAEVIHDILTERRELRWAHIDDFDAVTSAAVTSDPLIPLRSLFYGRPSVKALLAGHHSERDNAIQIGPTQHPGILTCRFGVYSTTRLSRRGVGEDIVQTVEYLPQLAVEMDGEKWNLISPSSLGRYYRLGTFTGNGQAQFYKVKGVGDNEIGQWWDRVSLTDLEDTVLDCLRSVYPEIRKVNFIGSDDPNSNARTPYARLAGIAEPVPLRSLGDGLQRLFGVLLAMATAAGGTLLLDEIESGFHYTIQPQIWRFLFDLSRRLHVQVFATTHSWDCIEAFQQAASEDDDPTSGVLIRLLRRGDETFATVFDEADLAQVTKSGIEVR